jgi:hypothetical protein
MGAAADPPWVDPRCPSLLALPLPDYDLRTVHLDKDCHSKILMPQT